MIASLSNTNTIFDMSQRTNSLISFVNSANGNLLFKANNLSDVANTVLARQNLGLVIGTNIQAYSAALASISGLTLTSGNIIYTTGTNTFATSPITTAGRALIDDADAAAQRATLGLGNVDNTSDANKPVSTATQTALDLKANLASPTFTGTPAAPTATAGTNTTQLATTAFVTSAISTKANLASPALTGTPTAPTATSTTNTTQIATTAFVQGQVTTLQSSISSLSSSKADIASPTFTGTPAAPTATAGTNTTQLATTAFVTSALTSKANLASPALTGTPTAPTATSGTNTTQIATTAFVQTTVNSIRPKALVNFSGSNPASIRSQYNIYSVVRTSTGAYRITFETAMQNANYVVSVGVSHSGGSVISCGITGQTTGYLDVQCWAANQAVGGAFNPDIVCITIFEV